MSFYLQGADEGPEAENHVKIQTPDDGGAGSSPELAHYLSSIWWPSAVAWRLRPLGLHCSPDIN